MQQCTHSKLKLQWQGLDHAWTDYKQHTEKIMLLSYYNKQSKTLQLQIIYKAIFWREDTNIALIYTDIPDWFGKSTWV